MSIFNARTRQLLLSIPGPMRHLSVAVLFLSAAFLCSSLLSQFTGGENNSALVYVLAILFIAQCTPGYFYGVLSSLVAGFLINFFFMYPYAEFSLEFTGYPMAMLSMVTISIVVCALTSRVKLQAQEAAKREQSAKALYELNQRLNNEKNTIQLEKDRETIRSNILRSVSHDLRTPLTAISGAAAVLLSSEDAQSGRDTSLLSDIKDDADSLIAMVENLLSITRIHGDADQLHKQCEMLEEVAGDAVLKIRRRFPQAKIEFTLSDDILYLPMDPILIKQVIFNLLENSIRHSGDLEHIRLNLFLQDRWAVAEVRDKGNGLSSAICQAILAGRQLSRSTDGDSSRGMGIGLSVCQSIIKAHGGFFAAGNDPKGGAVFRFGLPMEEFV